MGQLRKLILPEAPNLPPTDPQAHLGAGEEVLRPFALVECHPMASGWMRALCAADARADAATDTDGNSQVHVGDVDAVRVYELVRVGDVAAQADREVSLRLVMPVASLGHRLCDAEKTLPVGHLADLDVYPIRVKEGAIHI